MAAHQITDSQVRRLTQELHAKDAELRAKDMELCELKEERSAILLLYVQEFMELQKRLASTTNMLEASAVLLQKVGDTIGGQASRLEHERADRDKVQDRLNHLPCCHASVTAVRCLLSCQCDHVVRQAKPVRPPDRLQRAAAS